MRLTREQLVERAAWLERLTQDGRVLSDRSLAAVVGRYERAPKLSPERQAVHHVIREQLRDEARAADHGGRILLVSGGLPGAGKSTILAQQRELEPDRIPYVTVDPDDIRDRLFAQVLRPDGQHPALVDHPDLEGMPGGPPTPRELSSVFHAEAARIAVDHRRWLTTENVSFVYDTTMHSYDAVRVVAESAHRNEYEVSGIEVWLT